MSLPRSVKRSRVDDEDIAVKRIRWTTLDNAAGPKEVVLLMLHRTESADGYKSPYSTCRPFAFNLADDKFRALQNFLWNPKLCIETGSTAGDHTLNDDVLDFLANNLLGLFAWGTLLEEPQMQEVYTRNHVNPNDRESAAKLTEIAPTLHDLYNILRSALLRNCDNCAFKTVVSYVVPSDHIFDYDAGRGDILSRNWKST